MFGRRGRTTPLLRPMRLAPAVALQRRSLAQLLGWLSRNLNVDPTGTDQPWSRFPATTHQWQFPELHTTNVVSKRRRSIAASRGPVVESHRYGRRKLSTQCSQESAELS